MDCATVSISPFESVAALALLELREVIGPMEPSEAGFGFAPEKSTAPPNK